MHRGPTEATLIGAGVMCAACSLAFAVFMAADADRTPFFAGAEYLGLFAKPTTSRVNYPAAASLEQRFREIDFTPTGTIDAAKPLPASRIQPTAGIQPEASAGVARAMSGFTLHGIIGDEALVLGPGGLQLVRVGSQMRGGGTVTGFAMSGNRWSLYTTQGTIESIR